MHTNSSSQILKKEEGSADLQARAEAADLNPHTFLATDYLNHFNEIVMLMEMVPEMPGILEECQAWEPRSYCEHFENSGFRHRDLAIATFEKTPVSVRYAFESTVEQANRVVSLTLKRMASAPDSQALRRHTLSGVAATKRLIDVMGGIIHGSVNTLDQAEIDAMLEG